jgi:hypothetical protein
MSSVPLSQKLVYLVRYYIRVLDSLWFVPLCY